MDVHLTVREQGPLGLNIASYAQGQGGKKYPTRLSLTTAFCMHISASDLTPDKVDHSIPHVDKRSVAACTSEIGTALQLTCSGRDLTRSDNILRS